MTSVSVIIPVYNDRERLKRCLEALDRQTYPAQRYEIIVVDNGSEVSPAAVTERFDNVRLLHEPQPGSYAARNRGLAAADGELIAFTDADCRPARDWLERGVACFERVRDCGLVAGRVAVTARRPERPTASERYDQLFYLDQKQAVTQGHYGATANLFTSRAVIEAVGPFDADLVSAGDNEWGQRVHRAGFAQVYCPEAVVQHPARRSLKTLLRKELRIAGGLACIEAGDDAEAAPKPPLSLSERVRRLGQPLRNVLGVMVGRTSRRIPSLAQRFQVAGIMALVRVLRGLEAWRVRWGGTPHNT